MPVTTTSAAIHIAPVVIKTFLRHEQRKSRRTRDSEQPEHTIPQDDLFFDEAFNIVKAFIELGNRNTIESLQAFTNTHVPAPYWAVVCPVTIPLSCCNSAADALIDWFGPEELKIVVGGERWWQVRGLNGVDAEWVAEKRDVFNTSVKDKKIRMTDVDINIGRMEHLDSIMLYVHGGGYSWGSINTHRHQVLHHVEKFNGRAFVVNYRKAPQYPWPCPLQDVIAAYLYLIRPPPGSPHNAIPHSKIVFAGDSAGGGLCLTVLTILRDLDLPMPAGAVLISPWVDLTHSFPSVIKNYETDILPKHGFLAKPSTLWPLPTQPPNSGRVWPGTVDTSKPVVGFQDRQGEDFYNAGKLVKSRQARQEGHESPDLGPDFASGSSLPKDTSNNNIIEQEHLATKSYISPDAADRWQSKPAKLSMQDPNAVPLELCSQIQMYATTEQIIHPLVSPVLQGSLGNLPPLYIIAGDGEVLRDEIIYLAHKAAHPLDYPAKEDSLGFRRQKENREKFKKPTNVHLQVFDGMCHVLTVFMFTKSAKYAYRSIGEFIKHATTRNEEHAQHPFPETERSPETVVPDLYSSDIRKGIFDGLMIRQRVDLQGTVRPMEPPEAIPALHLEVSEIGLIKEVPVLRWAEGQNEWDKRYHKKTLRVLKQKIQNEDKAAWMIKNALRQGFIHVSHDHAPEYPRVPPKQSGKRLRKRTSLGKIQRDRRWGPLDLGNECPPPSAIAARRDTPEALALLKKHIYFTAPVTHLTVPKLRASDAMWAALDPDDDPNRPPPQSASEMQVKPTLIPLHGLKMWDKILRYLGRKSSAKAAKWLDEAAMNVEDCG